MIVPRIRLDHVIAVGARAIRLRDEVGSAPADDAVRAATALQHFARAGH